jgi:hypothetical protein
MAADPNIFQSYLNPVKSVAEYSNELDKQEANQLTLAASRISNKTAQQAFDDDQAYRTAAAESGGDQNALVKALYAKGLAQKAQAIQASGIDLAHKQSQTANENSQVSERTQKIQDADRMAHIKAAGLVQTPEDALAWSTAAVKKGILTPEQFQAGIQRIPADPQGLQQWKGQVQQGGLSVLEQMHSNEPKPTETRLGNVVKYLDMNPRSPTFGKEVTPAQQVGQSPDSVATNETSRANNAATQAGEDRRAAAGRSTQLQVAGVQPGGGLDENTERTAQAIAKGQLPAPTGMALLNPKNQRVLGRVMEINPQYDYTEVAAKKSAATSFGTGQLGNALRSVSTANAHLDQMNELVDALGNGNTQVINKVNNWYQTQTGNPAPTNFNAIKNVVGQEVVKAIVAGGGGVGEREEAAKAFSTANSPDQLKEAIQHYRMVMGAQADNLLAQRDAAGLSRSTLPNYNGAKPAAAGAEVPSDIQALLKKHGGGAR